MVSFAIRAITADDLPAVAAFLAGQRAGGAEDDAGAALGDTTDEVLRRLRWRLLANPFREAGLEFGQLVVASDETVAGTHLCYPWRFVLGEERHRGLCSGAFYVRADARMQGFLLLRRFLGLADVPIRFATTCNERSAALWAKLGATALPDLSNEQFLPLRYGALLEEWALRRDMPAAMCQAARAGGALATALRSRPRQRSGGVTLRPCRDWQRLAALAERCRGRDVLTCDRTADFLHWRYDASPVRPPADVLSLTDERGNEGWVALGYSQRGRRRQIRTCTVLDLVWSGGIAHTADILRTIAGEHVRDADMLVYRGRRLIWSSARQAGFRTHAYAPSRTHAIIRLERPPPSAPTLELCAADGDGLD